MNFNNIIINYLRTHGPAQPVQLSKALEKDAFTCAAILQEAVSNGVIKQSYGRIGNSNLYYLPEQEEEAKQKLFEYLSIIEKKLVNKVKARAFINQDELSAQERFIIKNLRDFLVPVKVRDGKDERIVWKYYKTSNEVLYQRIFSKPLQRTAPKTMTSPEPVQERVKPKASQTKGLNKAEKYFETIHAIVKDKKIVRKNSETNYVIEVTRGVNQKYFVKFKDKKKINEKDLSIAYAEGMDKKLPVILLTTGKLTSNAKEFNKKFGELLKVIQI